MLFSRLGWGWGGEAAGSTLCCYYDKLKPSPSCIPSWDKLDLRKYFFYFCSLYFYLLCIITVSIFLVNTTLFVWYICHCISYFNNRKRKSPLWLTKIILAATKCGTDFVVLKKNIEWKYTKETWITKNIYAASINRTFGSAI